MLAMKSALFSAMSVLSAQPQAIDPNRGTLQAYAGAQARFQDPTFYDAVFPFIAFVLVIALPVTIAGWVIFKTMTDPTKEPDET